MTSEASPAISHGLKRFTVRGNQRIYICKCSHESSDAAVGIAEVRFKAHLGAAGVCPECRGSGREGLGGWGKCGYCRGNGRSERGSPL